MPLVKAHRSTGLSYGIFTNPGSELAPDPIFYGSYASFKAQLLRDEKYPVNPGTYRIASALFEVYHLPHQECLDVYGRMGSELMDEILKATLDNLRHRQSVPLTSPKSIDAEAKFKKILRCLEEHYPLTADFFALTKQKMRAFVVIVESVGVEEGFGSGSSCCRP